METTKKRKPEWDSSRNCAIRSLPTLQRTTWIRQATNSYPKPNSRDSNETPTDTQYGDIYFTEQGLASFDYSPNVLPYSGYRQVYLGNIKDLLP